MNLDIVVQIEVELMAKHLNLDMSLDMVVQIMPALIEIRDNLKDKVSHKLMRGLETKRISDTISDINDIRIQKKE